MARALDELLCEGHVIQIRVVYIIITCTICQEGHPDYTKTYFKGNTLAALQLLTGQNHNGVLNLDDPLILNVLFMMLSELSTLLLNLFNGNVFYHQWIATCSYSCSPPTCV